MQVYQSKFKYKPGDDPIAVVARAIRDYFNDDEEKIQSFPSRQMAEIITSVFLDDTVMQTQELITKGKRLAEKYVKECHELSMKRSSLSFTINNLTLQIEQLTETKEALIQAIMETDGKPTGTIETDNALAGAKKAYDWIYAKTNDRELASKAFDSYLIGGRYEDGDTYEGDLSQIDAQKMIRKALTVRL